MRERLKWIMVGVLLVLCGYLINGSLQVNGDLVASGKGVFPDSLRAGDATFTGDCNATWGKWIVQDSCRVGSMVEYYFPTLADNATPSVAGSNNWKCTPASPTTITAFTGGTSGQVIRIVFTNGNATLGDTSPFKLASGFTSTADDVMTLIFDGTNWYEISRSVN